VDLQHSLAALLPTTAGLLRDLNPLTQPLPSFGRIENPIYKKNLAHPLASHLVIEHLQHRHTSRAAAATKSEPPPNRILPARQLLSDADAGFVLNACDVDTPTSQMVVAKITGIAAWAAAP
jgi:hypothetical protein